MDKRLSERICRSARALQRRALLAHGADAETSERVAIRGWLGRDCQALVALRRVVSAHRTVPRALTFSGPQQLEDRGSRDDIA